MAKTLCKDGTTDSTGSATPCANNGGVMVLTKRDTTSTPSGINISAKKGVIANMTTTQKVLAVVGITAVCYLILYKAGSLK